LFFSVQRNYVAQSGDPTGTGRGGESVFQKIYGDQARYFDMEIKPKIKHTRKGLVSFVNNGNNQHGSQFFVTLANALDYLDGKHTVFGEVSEGFDVIEKLNEAICDENDRPYQDIRINHTIILDDPFDDPGGLPIPDKSPEPTREQLQSDRIGADENVNEFEGKNVEEIQEIIEEKDLQIGTKILETIGDIPDADLKPPENVLFVCKLNPVTTADDLEIIFSRFGQIRSCEIIRDHKTGDSLCYGFIEFSLVDECEKAYLNMENVLIDDRRIHVDFCQSIATHKWNKSKLQGKYSFVPAYHDKPVKTKSSATKLEIKDKAKRVDQYQMVFEDRKSVSQKDQRIYNRERLKKREYSESSQSDSSTGHEKQKRKGRTSPYNRKRIGNRDESKFREASCEHSKRQKVSYKRVEKGTRRSSYSKDEASQYRVGGSREGSRSHLSKRKDEQHIPKFDRRKNDTSSSSPERKKKKKHRKH